MNEATPLEIELKLVLPGPDAEEAVVGVLRENGYTCKKLKEVTNVDLYLDTFDWGLLKKELSLRYRTAGRRSMYTLKGIRAMEEGIAKRMEKEALLEGPVAAPAEIPVREIRELVDGIISPRRLLEQVQVRTHRRRYDLGSPEGARIELAFDAATFSLRGLHKPRRARTVYELEAELRRGPETALASLFRLLADTFGYAPATMSKLEAAIIRLRVGIPSKKPPGKDAVRLDDRLDVAVRKILSYQFVRFREQLPGVKREIDTEFVHQARVATRRMRSALRLFRDAVPSATGNLLSRELQWVGGLFGAVRDLDVFLLNLDGFQRQLVRFPSRQKKVFERWIARHRQTPFGELVAGLDSIRFARFERRLSRFLESPLAERPRAPLAVKPVRAAAPPIIREKFTAVMEQGRKLLKSPKPKQFHRLRIQMKKLRYACEFMAPAYDGALDSFIERTVEIQDCLGELQDAVFTEGFVDTLFADWKGRLVEPELVFILGEIYQLQGEIGRERRAKFGKIWERFAGEETARQLDAVLSGALCEPLQQA